MTTGSGSSSSTAGNKAGLGYGTTSGDEAGGMYGAGEADGSSSANQQPHAEVGPSLQLVEHAIQVRIEEM